MAVVSPAAKAQFIDEAGVPLAGGFLYTYAAGTTTPQATYTDSTNATANSNPIILDSRGEANVWLASSLYKFKLADANNTEIWTVDNIAAPSTALSPVFGTNVTISTDSSGPSLLITQTGGGAAIRVQDSSDPDTTPFVVDNLGNVGIGIASPGNALDVADGAIQLSTAVGTARTVISADATDSVFEASANRNFTVKTNTATRLTINVSGASFTVPVSTSTLTATTVNAGAVNATLFTGAWANIPAGTAMLFAQTSAPTGWTKSTTHDNKALRVVSGSASSGGSVAFTTAFASQAVTGTVASHTLSLSDIPSHYHTATSTVNDPTHVHQYTAGGASGFGYQAGFSAANSSSPFVAGTGPSVTGITVDTTIGNTGGGGGHAHGFSAPNINLAVQYVDVIIATKN